MLTISNVNIFREFLKENQLTLAEVDLDDGVIAFRGSEELKNGEKIMFAFIFNDLQDIVDLQIYELAMVKDLMDRESVLASINELNINYRFVKFTLSEEGYINTESSIPLGEREIQPDEIIHHLLLNIHILEEAYPQLKLLEQDESQLN